MSNFREITQALLAAQAIRQVQPGEDLASTLDELLSDPLRAREMGARARAILETNRGATERTAAALEELLAAPQAAWQGAGA